MGKTSPWMIFGTQNKTLIFKVFLYINHISILHIKAMIILTKVLTFGVIIKTEQQKRYFNTRINALMLLCAN